MLLLFFVTALQLLMSCYSFAQWTTGAVTIYATDTTKRVAIGAKTGSYDLNIYRTGAATLGVRSYTNNANINIDKGSATGFASLAYRTNSVSNWNSGMLGNNDFSIKNVISSSFSLVITQSDNVGIGKTTPIQKLDINGKMNISGGVIQSGGTAITTTSDLGLYSRTSGNKIRIATNNGDIRFFTNDTSGVNASGANAVMAISNSGNIGMGILVPTARLDVNGKTKTVNFQMTTGAAVNKILRSDANGNSSWVSASSVESDPKVGSLTNNKVPHWNGSTLVNGLLFDNGNKIGIGTSAPSVLLHIKGNTDPAQILIDAGGSQGNSEPFIKFRSNAGTQLMIINTDDATNVFMGLNAGINNLPSGLNGMYNSYIGSEAGLNNFNGYSNTAVGYQSLNNSVNGFENSAVGALALNHNVDGRDNAAMGNSALANMFNSNFNTATGANAGITLINGDYNSFFGYQADVAQADLLNGTALGSYAIVNADNKVRIGDASIQVVESNAGSWTASDGRFKINVKEDVYGLEFIKLLRPVVYNFDSKRYEEHVMQNLPESSRNLYMAGKKGALEKATAIRQTGFIAQEVEASARACGYDFNGIHSPENPTDNYSLSYEKFVVPLVKSVQELASLNSDSEKRIKNLEKENELLRIRLDRLEEAMSHCCADVKEEQSEYRILNGEMDKSILNQNRPNPFNTETKITYYIPSGFQSAQLLISDAQGREIKLLGISQAGYGEKSIQAGILAPGSYRYSLLINGVVADTKNMEITK